MNLKIEEQKSKILEELKLDLADNFNVIDTDVLDDILNETITNALFISNRDLSLENILLLKPEIKKCVKVVFLERGVEDSVSLNENGKNSTFVDSYEMLRNDIVKNGKRVIA